MPDYIAMIRKESDSSYRLTFPDFPGCDSSGATLDEARRKGTEALHAQSASLRDAGNGMPEPSSLEDILRAHPKNQDALSFLVVTIGERERPAGQRGGSLAALALDEPEHQS
jgi:predicted RNase H-like HicB family nuclease